MDHWKLQEKASIVSFVYPQHCNIYIRMPDIKKQMPFYLWNYQLRLLLKSNNQVVEQIKGCVNDNRISTHRWMEHGNGLILLCRVSYRNEWGLFTYNVIMEYLIMLCMSRMMLCACGHRAVGVCVFAGVVFSQFGPPQALMHLLTTQQNERKPSASEPQFAVTHENGPEEEAHVLGGMRVRRPMVGVGGCSRVVSPLEVLLFPPDSQCSALSAGRLAVTSPLRWASLCACLLLSGPFVPQTLAAMRQRCTLGVR